MWFKANFFIVSFRYPNYERAKPVLKDNGDATSWWNAVPSPHCYTQHFQCASCTQAGIKQGPCTPVS